MKLTLNQLQHLPWKLKWHCSGDICVSVHEARVGFYPIIRQTHTERTGFCEYGKTVTKYRFNGRTYRSHKSVVEAINELLEKQHK